METSSAWSSDIEVGDIGYGERFDFLFAHQGIIENYKRELSAKTKGFNIIIEPGKVIIEKKIYQNHNQISMTVNRENKELRYDCILLNVDYAMQVVRLVIIQGVEAARPSYPSVTQLEGVSYQMPLYYIISIPDIGIFIAEDVRRFVTITSE